MKKKSLIIIGVVIIVISFLCYLGFVQNKPIERKEINKSKKGEVYSVYTDMHRKMDNKESFLLYFRNDDPYVCDPCNMVDSIVDFYHDVYNLDVIEFDTSYKDELKKINKDFDFYDDFIVNPAVMIFKDGEWRATANNINDEVFLKEHLVLNGMLQQKYADIETEIIDDKTFKEMFQSNEQHFIVVYSGDSDKLKRILYQISINESYFQYHSIIKGLYKNYNSFMSLWDEIGDSMENSTLVIINNNKVVDYLSSFDHDEIVNFLKKHQIIE